MSELSCLVHISLAKRGRAVDDDALTIFRYLHFFVPAEPLVLFHRARDDVKRLIFELTVNECHLYYARDLTGKLSSLFTDNEHFFFF